MKLQSKHKKYQIAMRRGLFMGIAKNTPRGSHTEQREVPVGMRFEKQPTPGGDFFAAAVASLIRIRPRGVK